MAHICAARRTAATPCQRKGQRRRIIAGVVVTAAAAAQHPQRYHQPQPEPDAAAMIFASRRHAGEQLAAQLAHRVGRADLVLGLVRGGLPVAEPVAAALGARLEPFVSRKIGAPGQPELGVGAVAEGGAVVLNEALARLVGATPEQLAAIKQAEEAELARRVRVYRGGADVWPLVRGGVVVLVDDGLATGATARAALKALRRHAPARLVFAVPTGAASSVAQLAEEGVADDVVALSAPERFRAVGCWYRDFGQTTDEEVLEIMRRHRQQHQQLHQQQHQQQQPGAKGDGSGGGGGQDDPLMAAHAPTTPTAAAAARGARPPAATPPVTATTTATAASAPREPQQQQQHRRQQLMLQPTDGDEEVVITAAAAGEGGAGGGGAAVALSGTLNIPRGACGVVLFAHGSGSSRHSPRNRAVAAELQRAARCGTLLMDLLTPAEAADRANVFDIRLLASRLDLAGRWLQQRGGGAVPLALFGASTGGGAALVAAAGDDGALAARVAAVVVRGGRPDLAGDALPRVRAPVLLIVGGDDHAVLRLNRDALERLGSRAVSRLEIVPHAGHLFEGPGQLEQVAALAAQFFAEHLPAGGVMTE